MSETVQKLLNSESHKDQDNGIAFEPCESSLASCRQDEKVKLWWVWEKTR